VSLRIEVFADDRWADSVAARFAERLADHPSARICLPTGATPGPVYRKLAERVDFSSATIFLLDEFVLPAGHPGRCDAMLERDLLGFLDDPPAEVHGLDTLAPNGEEECRRFERLVDRGGLDLVLLGLGGNGHLGLNEPGSAVDSPTRMVELEPSTTSAAARYDPDAHPTHGMTLGMRPIMDSTGIWLLVTGSHKAGVLRRMMHDPIGPGFPATFLRGHPDVTVFADRSAAAAL